MHNAAFFIHRPIATSLITLGVALAGAMAFMLLPVAPLPQVDFPVISVQASLPGASPETMAATVATPLERALGQIAGVNEITSSSSQGSTRVTLQFDLSRDINGAAREVQAGINATRPLLPSSLPSNPTYRKVNPASSPILVLALTSDTLGRGRMYDIADTILAQRIAQVEGIGQVETGGGALPAVRVDVLPQRLAALGLSMETVRTAIATANVNRPKGFFESGDQQWQIAANDQLNNAAAYRALIVGYANGIALRLGDIATVSDSVQDIKNFGSSNGKPAVLMILRSQPGANIIETVDRVQALMPRLRAMIPASVALDIVMDRTPVIRSSLREVERSLLLSCVLVVLVVLLFLRRARAALIPAVAVPVSLAGAFAIMYLCDYSLDNLSLMALTVATGFVVDDAIVVLENIVRHLEQGKSPFQAALDGVREIGFTVVSISLSLIAVFIPILAMGGIVGRFFREFAVTLSAAILISMLVSLTVTPAMAAHILHTPMEKDASAAPSPWVTRLRTLARQGARAYRKGLAWCLRHSGFMLLLLAAVIALNISLYGSIKKGFLPQQDTGRLMGMVQADQSISFAAMQKKMQSLMAQVQADPAVDAVTGFTGGNQRNSGMMFVSLKPLAERKLNIDQVIARLRGKLANEPGARLFLVPMQDVRVGGRSSQAQYQYTLSGDDLDDLRQWEPKVREAFSTLPELVDVNTDQQDKSQQTALVVDRDAAARLGLNMREIDTVLNNTFSQRLISTIYNPLNQYRVVLGAPPELTRSPDNLNDVRFTSTTGAQVPLSAFARVDSNFAPLSINHQSAAPASTISFNLPEGVSLSQASKAIDRKMAEIGLPTSVVGSFQGVAKIFGDSLASQPWLILLAILTIYIVLGILYENLLHPLTILSTLPSAGVGALLALIWFDTEFSLIALIGVILLIGIVKKNAIMMIDFAITAQRRGQTAAQAIIHAAHIRFRPILMTTLAAICGAIPLAIGSGDGAELRQPLGISIVGGLLVSQVLTLFTTPVVYVALDRLRQRWLGRSAVPPPLFIDPAPLAPARP